MKKVTLCGDHPAGHHQRTNCSQPGPTCREIDVPGRGHKYALGPPDRSGWVPDFEAYL